MSSLWYLPAGYNFTLAVISCVNQPSPSYQILPSFSLKGCSGEFPGGLAVRGPTLSPLRRGFYPRPGHFRVLAVRPKKTRVLQTARAGDLTHPARGAGLPGPRAGGGDLGRDPERAAPTQPEHQSARRPRPAGPRPPSPRCEVNAHRTHAGRVTPAGPGRLRAGRCGPGGGPWPRAAGWRCSAGPGVRGLRLAFWGRCPPGGDALPNSVT